ncbi:MAG: hypothetical protein ACYS8Z_20390, partial [Planctomycetota bacterium]
MVVLASVIVVLGAVGACDIPLPSDLNSDCAINFTDVLAMGEQWLGESGSANLEGSGRVNMVDFAALSKDWGNADGCDCNECENWQMLHPEWIFCDDFEDGTLLR